MTKPPTPSPTDVRQFLRSWSDFHVKPEGYPLTLEDAQTHADAFTRAAAHEGISQAQIRDAVRGSDLREVMVRTMRSSVEDTLTRSVGGVPLTVGIQ